MMTTLMTAALLLNVLVGGEAANLQAILDHARSAQDIPGVSAVVTRHDEVLFSGGSGVADLQTGRKMTADTVLYAGSLTKLLTGVLTLRLVDEGSISLDSTVDGIADNDPAEAPAITVAELLTHTSGLEREGNFGYWFSADFPDRASLRDYLGNTELRTVPGAKESYSNIGFAALGLFIEKTTGERYFDALRHDVLEPLGMDSTGSPGPVAGIARGYTPRGRIIPSAEHAFAGVGKAIEGRHLREYHDARAMTPAFGVYTTANDLGRLAQFLGGYIASDLLPAALRRRMVTPQASGRTLGLGIEHYNGRTIARHGGWFAAHKSHILIDPESGIGVVVMANSDNADPDAIAKVLFREALHGEQRGD